MAENEACSHVWWYRKAGTIEASDGKVDMYEARCTGCGAGRAMDGRLVMRELGLLGLVGKVVSSVMGTASKLLVEMTSKLLEPLFELDSPTNPGAPQEKGHDSEPTGGR